MLTTVSQLFFSSNCHLFFHHILFFPIHPVHTEIDVFMFQELYVGNEGQNVTFSCSAFGVSAPSLSWRRDGVELSLFSDSCVLLLPEVITQMDYMGPVYQTTRNIPGDMYQLCVAINTVGDGNNTEFEEAEDVGHFFLFVQGKAISDCCVGYSRRKGKDLTYCIPVASLTFPFTSLSLQLPPP